MRGYRLAIASLIGLALLRVVPAAAADKVDCANALSTVEMNICAGQDFERADARLNAVYADALAHVRTRDLPPPFDAKRWESALRSAQRAWIEWRDADCEALVPIEWSGGTGTTVAVLTCKTEKTEQRAKELTTRYAN